MFPLTQIIRYAGWWKTNSAMTRKRAKVPGKGRGRFQVELLEDRCVPATLQLVSGSGISAAVTASDVSASQTVIDDFSAYVVPPIPPGSGYSPHRLVNAQKLSPTSTTPSWRVESAFNFDIFSDGFFNSKPDNEHFTFGIKPSVFFSLDSPSTSGEISATGIDSGIGLLISPGAGESVGDPIRLRIGAMFSRASIGYIPGSQDDGDPNLSMTYSASYRYNDQTSGLISGVHSPPGGTQTGTLFNTVEIGALIGQTVYLDFALAGGGTSSGVQGPGLLGELYQFVEILAPDLVATDLQLGAKSNVEYGYNVEGRNVDQPVTIAFSWATGSDYDDRVGEVYTLTIAGLGTAVGSHRGDFDANNLGARPANATHVVMKLDSDVAITEANEANNELSAKVARGIDLVSATWADRHSGIVTDQIEVRARVEGVQPGTKVFWTVQGRDAAAKVKGFAKNVTTTTDADGMTTFRFKPSDNKGLVKDRRTTWQKGRKNANPPISFEVIAKVTINATVTETRLSQTSLGLLTQDATDRLRQEYYDYNIPVPTRSQVVSSLGAGFNKGNYGVQLSVGLGTRYNAILSAYRGRKVTVTYQGRLYATTIPADAVIGISSGYRNPQRNKAIGSKFPNSKHTRGRALDLVPGAVQVAILVNGKERTVPLPLHKVLYPALHAAASTQGNAIAEESATPVPVGDPRENHIHVQW